MGLKRSTFKTHEPKTYVHKNLKTKRIVFPRSILKNVYTCICCKDP